MGYFLPRSTLNTPQTWSLGLFLSRFTDEYVTVLWGKVKLCEILTDSQLDGDSAVAHKGEFGTDEHGLGGLESGPEVVLDDVEDEESVLHLVTEMSGVVKLSF